MDAKEKITGLDEEGCFDPSEFIADITSGDSEQDKYLREFLDEVSSFDVVEACHDDEPCCRPQLNDLLMKQAEEKSKTNF